MREKEHSKIQIRCPKCAQKFLVGGELRGRMVECGACEHRFRVDDETVSRTKKFYPGERKDPMLNRYSRPVAQENPTEVTPSVYEEPEDLPRYEPTPFSKILVGIAGGSLMVIILLILITGASQNGLLSGVTTERRLLMGGFAAIVGGAMLIYANPKTRAKATFFVLLASGCLLLAPVFFTEGSQIIAVAPAASTAANEQESTMASVNGVSSIKLEVGYAPVEKALVEAGPSGRVLAIWLRGLRESNVELVQNFLVRVSGADENSHLYPRLKQHYLLVLNNPQLSSELMINECARLGVVQQHWPDLHLIDVSVENDRFVQQPIGKLSDKKDGTFYQLNLRELQGIDLRRINEALIRLSMAEPVQSRDDIVKRLIELLAMSDKEMLINVCKALMVWSNGKDRAPEVATQKALEFYAKNSMLPHEVVAFLAKWRQPEVYPILDDLWQQEPVVWEEIYMRSGEPAEARLLPHLVENRKQLRMSAARIASRVGGKKSLDLLEELIAKEKDLELQSSFENARDAIQQRLR
jgi:hypothetical protein